jgi:predicted acylesterase/phospholipase RssA
MALALVAGLSGCATTARNRAILQPTDAITHVMTSVGGVPIRERYYPGQGMVREAVVAGPLGRPTPAVRADGTVGYDLLALSGGGSNGAFGAGYLCGWTKAGTRPVFQVVTGISTGSLLSSFAFAGPAFDGRLRQAFTTIQTPMIYRRRPLIALPWSDSIGRTDPLDHLIATYADSALLQAVAEGHRQGRRLYVGTTDLDHKRLIIWDMGSVAACGHPGAPELYRRVLRASSSIPVLFNPIEFPVVFNDMEFSELHVDGGVRTQVFMRRPLLQHLEPIAARDGDVLVQPTDVSASSVPGQTIPLNLAGSRLFILVNGKLRPDSSAPARRLLPIAEESLHALMSAEFNGDLYRMLLLTSTTGMQYQLQAIPADLRNIPNAADFNPDAMTRLFLTGHELARSGTPWMPAPRGLDDSELQLLAPNGPAPPASALRSSERLDREPEDRLALPVEPRPGRTGWRAISPRVIRP